MQRFILYLVTVTLSTCCITARAQQFELPVSPSVNSDSRTNDQSSTPFVIRTITITGNRKTRAPIILRELPFKPGDHFQLQQLVVKFEAARRQLMNTTLFHEVTVALKSFEGYNVDILIEVKERWYIFPLPYFKI